MEPPSRNKWASAFNETLGRMRELDKVLFLAHDSKAMLLVKAQRRIIRLEARQRDRKPGCFSLPENVIENGLTDTYALKLGAQQEQGEMECFQPRPKDEETCYHGTQIYE
jgi:hypothetical protein